MSARGGPPSWGDTEHDRLVLGLRAGVISALSGYVPYVGTSGVGDCVDEALARLYAAGRHRGELDQVRRRWLQIAGQRLSNERCSAQVRYRDMIPVEEHAQAALAVGDQDVSAAGEAERAHFRVQELLSIFVGDELLWVRAWFDDDLEAGGQPRGLHEDLGWSARKTRRVAARVRAKMLAFMKRRASGGMCVDQQLLLNGVVGSSRSTQVEEERLRRVLLHTAGCEDCRAAWITRGARARERVQHGLLIAFDPLVGVLHALGTKTMKVGAVVHSETFALRQRVGFGGGETGAASTVVPASMSGRTAAACIGAVCAAAGGGGAVIVSELPAIKAHPRQVRAHAQRQHRPHVRVSTPPAPAQIVSSATSTAPTGGPAASATPPVARPGSVPAHAAQEASFTPGDLPPDGSQPSGANSAPRSAPPRPPPPPALASASGASTARCVPGDLGC